MYQWYFYWGGDGLRTFLFCRFTVSKIVGVLVAIGALVYGLVYYLTDWLTLIPSAMILGIMIFFVFRSLCDIWYLSWGYKVFKKVEEAEEGVL
jgi:MFS superfamily sulfate permease-like transporter